MNTTNEHEHDHDMNFSEELLTAYALGELEGDDATTIEAALASSESLRAEVEAIRATASLLTAELAAEPAPSLTEEQRTAVLTEPKANT